MSIYFRRSFDPQNQFFNQSETIPQIAEATKKISELEFLSRMNSVQVLDDKIVMEEIEGAIKRIK